MNKIQKLILAVLTVLIMGGGIIQAKPYMEPAEEEDFQSEPEPAGEPEEIRDETVAEMIPANSAREVISPVDIAPVESMAPAEAGKVEKPRNIILMVPNGMGISMYGLIRYMQEFVEEKSLNMDRVMNGNTGYLLTHSLDSVISDNASAASAIATGVKVKNGIIGVTPDGRKPRTVLDRVKDLGLGVGMITTSDVTDAFTAAFSAHTEDEDQKESIAVQLLKGDLDVLMGGGFKWFNSKTRSDGKNLLELAQRNNYAIVTNTNELSKIRIKNTNSILGLFSDRMLEFSEKDSKDEPTLAHMTRIALGILEKNDKGFFLLVEGGRIAHAAHGNLMSTVINEVLAFDEAVGVVQEFIKSNPETLLVITPSIDVGNPVLSRNNWKEEYIPKSNLSGILGKKKDLVIWPTQYNTATPVFIAAVGPGSEKISGVMDNIEVFELLEPEDPEIREKREELERLRLLQKQQMEEEIQNKNKSKRRPRRRR